MPTILEYKLELLKCEINAISSAIVDKDQMCRQIKQWAVTLWIAAVGFTGLKHIGEPSLSSTLWAASTGLIPILLSILDLYTKRAQRKYMWRERLIHEFLNDVKEKQPGSLSESFALGDIKQFRVYDPACDHGLDLQSEQQRKEYQAFISVYQMLRNPRIFLLYVCLSIFSALLVVLPWLVFLLES